MIRSSITCALSCVLLAGVLPGQDLLVRGGRVIAVDGPGLPRGSVLIKGGRIERVGRRLAAGATVPVLDATGKVVMPGFVLAHTSRGLDRANERVPVTPFVSVLDSLDPSNVFFEDGLRDGHLTMLVMPGDATVIGGMGRVVRPHGLTVEAMTVVADAGLKISLIPPTGNRAAHLAKLRAALEDARRHLAKKERDKDPAKTLTGNVTLDLKALSVDRRKRALVRLLKGEIPAYVSCGTPADVIQALKLEKEYGINVRLICGPGTWRAASYLARKNIPVILGPVLELRETDPDTGKEVTRIIPRIFHEAGVRFAVTSNPSSLGGRYLWYQAACLVRYGIPRDVALRAVTLHAAELIGLGDRKGSVAAGKDGDLLILTDDPLSGRAWVDKAVIGGYVVYDRRKDPRLADVFGTQSR